jgi:hypothetical protein
MHTIALLKVSICFIFSIMSACIQTVMGQAIREHTGENTPTRITHINTNTPNNKTTTTTVPVGLVVACLGPCSFINLSCSMDTTCSCP